MNIKAQIVNYLKIPLYQNEVNKNGELLHKCINEYYRHRGKWCKKEIMCIHFAKLMGIFYNNPKSSRGACPSAMAEKLKIQYLLTI